MHSYISYTFKVGPEMILQIGLKNLIKVELVVNLIKLELGYTRLPIKRL